MSLFKLPTSLCNGPNSIFSNFWWGSYGDARNISLCSWEKLCKRKEECGMEFKNLLLFFKALLAKQAWQILSNPSLLSSKVLRAKYLRHYRFLETKTKVGSSHIWQGILWERDILIEGVPEWIGDGRTTLIKRDSWIPKESIFHPTTVIHYSSMTVAKLINQKNRK